MYNKILVPIALDHDRDCAAAIAIAERLAAPGAETFALTVIEEIPAYISNYMPKDHSKTVMAEVGQELRKRLSDRSDVTPVVVHGHAGRAIVDYAQKHGFDCIVIASHRPGLQDFFIGSTALRVVKHAACAVHVLR